MNDFYMHLAVVYKCNICIPTSNLSFKNNKVLHLKTNFQYPTAGLNAETCSLYVLFVYWLITLI